VCFYFVFVLIMSKEIPASKFELEMSSSSRAEQTLTSPTECSDSEDHRRQALMVATGSGDIQQLKDLVKKQEQDSKMIVLVMAIASSRLLPPWRSLTLTWGILIPVC
jgi:hypothetical protein